MEYEAYRKKPIQFSLCVPPHCLLLSALSCSSPPVVVLLLSYLCHPLHNLPLPPFSFPPGVVKDWLLIAFSWSVIMDRVTTVNLLGYLLAFAGVCWYNHTKLQVGEEDREGLGI